MSRCETKAVPRESLSRMGATLEPLGKVHHSNVDSTTGSPGLTTASCFSNAEKQSPVCAEAP